MYVSYFIYHLEGIPNKNSLRKEPFIWAHSLRVQSTVVEKPWGRSFKQLFTEHLQPGNCTSHPGLAGSTNPVPRILTLITFLSLLASFPVGTLHVVAKVVPTAESSTLPVRKTQ